MVRRKPWWQLQRAVSEEWKRRRSRWFAWPRISVMPVRAAKLPIKMYTWRVVEVEVQPLNSLGKAEAVCVVLNHSGAEAPGVGERPA